MSDLDRLAALLHGAHSGWIPTMAAVQAREMAGYLLAHGVTVPDAEMAAFDRAEFDALLKEVVALREWKRDHEAAAFRAAPVPSPSPAARAMAERGGWATLVDSNRFRAILAQHWVVEVRCDEEHHTDTAICSCALWHATPQPNVGAAIAAWASHVAACYELGAEPPAAERGGTGS